MWIVLTALLLATPALGHYLHIFPQVPEEMVFENTFHVRRSTIHIECPHHAVCGVAFDFNRTGDDGIDVPERRIIQNCMCPGGHACPIVPDHRVFSSIRRREYLCIPRSRLSDCLPGNDTQPAKELVEGSEEYEFRNYFRVNCLCPRHMNPRVPIPRERVPNTRRHGRRHRMQRRRRVGRLGMALATSIRRVRHDEIRDVYYHERECIYD